MHEQALIDTANALVTPGKGILAADESTGTIKKRLDSIDVESTEASRQTYRNLLFTTGGAEEFISGVILFEETLFQKADDGKPFPQLLADRGIIPGIKVDKGAKALAGSPEEKVTEGLDGLRDRLQNYVDAGARFAKWRGVIDIADGRPTDYCIDVNAHALARYAALCQEAGVVPIVEPEVLMDGANSIERCEQVTDAVLDRVFAALKQQRILLEGIFFFGVPRHTSPRRSTAGSSARSVRSIPGRSNTGVRSRFGCATSRWNRDNRDSNADRPDLVSEPRGVTVRFRGSSRRYGTESRPGRGGRRRLARPL